MNQILLALKCLLILTLTVACSNAGESGPRPRQNKLQNTEKDSLKGKSKAEVVRLKYNELKAHCALIVVETNIEGAVTQSVIADDVQTQEIKNPVTVENDKLVYDLKIQAESDQDLVQGQAARLINTSYKLQLNIRFKALAVLENNNIRSGDFIYLRKHTPQLSLVADLIEDMGSGRTSTITKTMDLNEGLQQEDLIKSILTAEKKTEYKLKCKLSGEIKEEYASQFVDLNCQDKPTEKTERMHALYCKPQTEQTIL